MKKIAFTICLSFLVFLTNAQDSASVRKVYRNEFGIDASAFLKQFIFISNSDFGGGYYDPFYYLTYTPVTDQYPALPDVDKPKVKSTTTGFSQPLFVVITFDI